MEEKLEIHYYFNDDTHGMNAFIRKKAEKEILDSIKQLSDILQTTISVDTEAYDEGGLIEYLTITSTIGAIALYVRPSVNKYITYYFTKKSDEEKSLELELKREQLKGLKLDNNKKENEPNDEILVDVLEDPYIIRHVSSFYKQVDGYEKIVKIGFKSSVNNVEHIVHRRDFKKFILIDDTTIIEDNDAYIEIISPVLNTGTYKWRGKYNKEIIDFSMGDTKFKKEISEAKHHFVNGTIINCSLQITIKTNDLGDDKKSYSVKDVYGTQESISSKLEYREIGKSKKHDKWVDDHTGHLFKDDE